jgi:hypothetical protein
MPTFYLAWRCKEATPPIAAPFEYLIHPMGEKDATVYCTALVNAPDKTSAWDLVKNRFQNCEPIYSEVADALRISNYFNVRQIPSIRVVPAGGPHA